MYELKPNDKPKYQDFYNELQHRLKKDGFSKHIMFSDEATYHLSGKVNQYNIES